MYDMAKERNTKVVAVSLPPDDAVTFDRLASAEGRNRSEMFREMLRVYQTYVEIRSFESLQRYGASRASVVGVRTERDVERLIRDARA
jgi:metal-responsive CopG/Arc/MetJ family transcriptional regulator